MTMTIREALNHADMEKQFAMLILQYTNNIGKMAVERNIFHAELARKLLPDGNAKIALDTLIATTRKLVEMAMVDIDDPRYLDTDTSQLTFIQRGANYACNALAELAGDICNPNIVPANVGQNYVAKAEQYLEAVIMPFFRKHPEAVMNSLSRMQESGGEHAQAVSDVLGKLILRVKEEIEKGNVAGAKIDGGVISIRRPRSGAPSFEGIQGFFQKPDTNAN